MLLLSFTVALRYYNCCTDGSTSPRNYGYLFVCSPAIIMGQCCWKSTLTDIYYVRSIQRFRRSYIVTNTDIGGYFTQEKRPQKHSKNVGFEVLTVIDANVAIFWDTAPCSAYVYRRFGEAYDFHLQGMPSHLLHTSFLLGRFSTLKMEVLRRFTYGLQGAIFQRTVTF
jgi:hypothetical protein